MALQAKDLMIGDLLTFADCIKEGSIVSIRVAELHEYDNEFLASIDGDKNYDIMELTDEIVGIPLTPEILEKNGFVEDDNDDCWGDVNCFFIPNYVDKNIISWETHIEPTNGRGDFSGNLTYVHELQHALRLCGIEKTIEL